MITNVQDHHGVDLESKEVEEDVIEVLLLIEVIETTSIVVIVGVTILIIAKKIYQDRKIADFIVPRVENFGIETMTRMPTSTTAPLMGILEIF